MGNLDQSRVKVALRKNANHNVEVEDADFTDVENEFEHGLTAGHEEDVNFDDIDGVDYEEEDDSIDDDVEDPEDDYEDEDGEDEDEDEDEEDEEDDAEFDSEMDEILNDVDGEDEEDDLVNQLIADAHANAGQELFTDVDDISSDALLGAQSLADMINLSAEQHTTTTSISSEVLITIDLTEPEQFSKFTRKQLSRVTIDGQEEPVNLYLPLHRKKNGVAVNAVNDILDYSSVMSENPLNVITTQEQATETVNFLKTGIDRSVSTLVSESLGVEDSDKLELLVASSEIADRIAELSELDELSEEQQAELDALTEQEDEDCTMITLDDLLRVSTFVSTSGDLEADAVCTATLVTHLALRFPAIAHPVNVKDDKSVEVMDRIVRVIEKLVQSRPNVKVRLGYTMNSTYAISDTLGRKLSDHLLSNGYTPYSQSDVSFENTPLNASEYISTGDGIELGRQVFTFGGDVIYLIDVDAQEEESEE